MFSRYVMFELKRLLKMPKNVVVVVLFAISILVFYAFNYYMYESTRGDRVGVLSEEIAASNAEIPFYRRINDTPTGEVIYHFVNDYLVLLRQEHVSARLLYVGGEYDDRWHAELRAIISREETVLIALYKWREAYAEELAAAGITGTDILKTDFADTNFPLRHRLNTEAEVIASIQKFRYLQNTEVRPVLSPYDMSGWQFLYRLVTVFGMFAIPALVVFLSADTFSIERDMGSYKFLLLQPMSRTQVYAAKLTASILLSTGVILCFMIILFGLNAAVSGIESANYPVRFMFSGGDVEVPVFNGENAAVVLNSLNPGTVMPAGFISIRTFLIYAVLYLLIYTVFLVSFTALISILADDSITALALSLGLVIVSQLIALFIPRRGFAWNPLEYSDTAGLATQTLNGVIWYPAAWLLALVTLGILCFRKKDIIC